MTIYVLYDIPGKNTACGRELPYEVWKNRYNGTDCRCGSGRGDAYPRGGGVNAAENLAPENYDIFARFIADVTEHFAGEGLAFDRIDTHTYGGSKRSQLKRIAETAGKNLWMSEVDGSWNGFQLAERIILDMNGMQPSAWVMWDIIDVHKDAEFTDPNGKNTEKDGYVAPRRPLWGVSMADHDKAEHWAEIKGEAALSGGRLSTTLKAGTITTYMIECDMAGICGGLSAEF